MERFLGAMFPVNDVRERKWGKQVGLTGRKINYSY